MLPPKPRPPRSPTFCVSLYHGRSWVSGPAVAPDGQRIAFVVATIDLDENTTTSRVWLTGPDGDPAPVTAGPHDAQPAWSPDGRFLAFTSKRGEKEKEATLRVMPVAGPGEVRTLGSMPEGFTQPTWSPDGKLIAFTSRTRDKRYDAKDESWQPPRKIETFFTQLNGEGWIADRPSHVYVVNADGTGTPRNLTPGPHHHSGISWLPDSSAIVTSAARHDGWDLDLAVDLYVVPLDGEIRALTHQTGNYIESVRLPRRDTRRPARGGRPGGRPAELGGRDHRHRRRRDHVDLLGARPQLAALPESPVSRSGPTTTRCSPPSRIAARPISTSWWPTGRGHLKRSPRGPLGCKASTRPAERWRSLRRRCNAQPSCSPSTARSPR